MTDTSPQVYQTLIKSGPEQIWDALVRPEFTRRYWFGVDVETAAVPGTAFRHLAPDGTVLVDGEVLDADAPHRLAVAWHPLYDPAVAAEPAGRVGFLVEEHAPGVCLVTVTHDHLDASPHTADNVRGIGWTTVLSALKTLLETGEPLFGERA